MLHPEQAKLLYHDDYQFYVKAYMPHATHGALFVFGRVLRMEEYLAKVLQEHPGMVGHVHRYFEHATNGEVPSWAHTRITPKGEFRFENVESAWPIDDILFRKVEAVGWDLTHQDAPLSELENTIRDMRRHLEDKA